MNYLYIIGQIFGIIAVILGFLTYQMKTQKQIMIVLITTCFVFTTHYFLIGAMTGCILNFVGGIRCICFLNRDGKKLLHRLYPAIFALIMAGMGILFWEDWYSFLAVGGLVINTLCIALKNPQSIRKSILITSPMVLAYDIIVKSYGGAVYESVAIISAVIGLIRYKEKQMR